MFSGLVVQVWELRMGQKMDPEEITRLYRDLWLEKGDKAVMRMDRKTYRSGKRNMECCLMGNIFGNKMINREAFQWVILGVW